MKRLKDWVASTLIGSIIGIVLSYAAGGALYHHYLRPKLEVALPAIEEYMAAQSAVIDAYEDACPALRPDGSAVPHTREVE